MSRARWLLLVVMGLLPGCRVHDLEDGPYQFTLTQVLRDDCGLAAHPEVASTGTLRTTGNVVALEYGYLDLKLVGTYLTRAEAMTMDGAAVNVSTQVRGHDCLLDAVSMHLDTTTVDATTFTGAMKLVFDARTPDACVCQAWFRYSAQRIGN